MFSFRIDEKIERVVHRHLGDQVDFDAKSAHWIRKRQARDIVALRILLPVDEMAGRLDAHGIRDDGRAAVRSRAQPDKLLRHGDRTFVTIVRDMGERDLNGHAPILAAAPTRPSHPTFLSLP